MPFLALSVSRNGLRADRSGEGGRVRSPGCAGKIFTFSFFAVFVEAGGYVDGWMNSVLVDWLNGTLFLCPSFCLGLFKCVMRALSLSLFVHIRSDHNFQKKKGGFHFNFNLFFVY